MQVYLVGGAVRDELLGLPIVERDWVVVGADRQQMAAQGFVPVDPTFPVFRHPESGEEYALARRETKRGEGYRGFVVDAGPDVTLEEDLGRRDLTINAIARDAQGRLIDPYGGLDDLDARRLRHVSTAFVEDPLRVLRVARFAAKLGHLGFRVAHETHRLMRQMVQRGDMAHVNPERLWREMRKAIAYRQPWRFFEVLQRCGALAQLIPVLADCVGSAAAHARGSDSRPIAVLRRISAQSEDPVLRLAAMMAACLQAEAAVDAWAGQVRADRAAQQLTRRAVAGAAAAARAERGDLDALLELAAIWRVFDDAGALEPMAQLYQAQRESSALAAVLRAALPAARAVAVAPLRQRGLTGAALGAELARQRRTAMDAALRRAGLVT